MKKTLLLLSLGVLLVACGQSSGEADKTKETSAGTEKSEKPTGGKGIGEIKKVTLNDPLNPIMVARGKSIYEMKCSPCHLLTDYRVIGPGWQGITNRRRPEWIMNMITNVDAMLDQDPTAQALLEDCFTRMPDDGISVGDALDILEFMYANDGKAVGK